MQDIFQRAVNMAGTAILIVDENLEVTFANKAALNLLQQLQKEILKVYPGFTLEKIIGTTLTSINAIPHETLLARFKDPQRKLFSDFIDLGKEKINITLHPLIDDTTDAGTVVELWYATEYLEGQAHMKKITDISTVINELTFQANILALNAAVEAAHAGKEGRVFAVIAEEMRNLSQRCRAAAQELLKK
jgi:hypothetical protein